MNSTPTNTANRLKSYRDEMDQFGLYPGVGIGTDIQGVTSQTTGDDGFKVTYPFTSVDGLVTFTEPTLGERSFDFAEEGIAHYGLLAEWLENYRLQKGRRRLIDY